MSSYVPPITISEAKDVRVVEFTANKILDEASIKEIGDGVADLVDKQDHPRLLIDFGHVDHLSSAALGMLININSRIRAKNGMLRLTNIKPQIREVFVITKLDKLFKIMPTRQEGLDSFGPAPGA
jgi:anti-sigma B factor antagonist